MKKKRKAHDRLKKLRKIIGFTQKKLAEKCGVSYPYFLAVETGQRKITETFALRVSFATGVSRDWLMYSPGTGDAPFNWHGPYNKETWEGHCRFDAARYPGTDFGDVGDELLFESDAIDELCVALRAAWRLGKFNVAILMVRELSNSMQSHLKLSQEIIRQERSNDVPREVLEADLANDLPVARSVHLLLPYLSSLARYKWRKAFDEGGEKERTFLEDLNEVNEMINHSFSLRFYSPPKRILTNKSIMKPLSKAKG